MEVGGFVGLLLGGKVVGIPVGFFVGDKDKVGLTLGVAVGFWVGCKLGKTVGASVI